MQGSDDDYMPIDPTSYDGGGVSPILAHDAAITLKLIHMQLNDLDIDEKLKRDTKTILTLMTPYLNNAGMTRITRGQIVEFWLGYEKNWSKFKIFLKLDNPGLVAMKDWILDLYIMNLNKSIDGWLGDRVFKTHHVYDVKQRREQRADRVRRWFKGKDEMEGEYG